MAQAKLLGRDPLGTELQASFATALKQRAEGNQQAIDDLASSITPFLDHVHRSQASCAPLLAVVVQQFSASKGSLELLDTLLFEVVSPLAGHADHSPDALEEANSLLRLVAEECTPREVVTLYLSMLDLERCNRKPAWRPLDELLLRHLPTALGRARRHVTALLQDSLQVVLTQVSRAMASLSIMPDPDYPRETHARIVESRDRECSVDDAKADRFKAQLTAYLEENIQLRRQQAAKDGQSSSQERDLEAEAILHDIESWQAELPADTLQLAPQAARGQPATAPATGAAAAAAELPAPGSAPPDAAAQQLAALSTGPSAAKAGTPAQAVGSQGEIQPDAVPSSNIQQAEQHGKDLVANSRQQGAALVASIVGFSKAIQQALVNNSVLAEDPAAQVLVQRFLLGLLGCCCPLAAPAGATSGPVGHEPTAASRAPPSGRSSGRSMQAKTQCHPGSQLAVEIVTHLLPAAGISSMQQLGSVPPAPTDTEAPAGELDTAELGAALALHWALCHPACQGALQLPEDSDDFMEVVADQAQVLLEASSTAQSEELADMALQLVAGAADLLASRDALARPTASHALQRLVLALVTTMVEHPVERLRHRAFRTLEGVLLALQVPAWLEIIDPLLHNSEPAVAAIILQHIQHVASQAWPQAAGAADQGPAPIQLASQTARSARWDALEPKLLPTALSLLQPQGDTGWQDPSGLVGSAEALGAALNLYRFVLLKEAADATNLTGARSKASLESTRQGVLLPLLAAAKAAELDMRAVVDRATPLTGAFDRAGPGFRVNPETDAWLGVCRVLEVATRVVEVVEEQLHSAI